MTKHRRRDRSQQRLLSGYRTGCAPLRVGKLQERYGMAREEAEHQIQAFLDSLDRKRAANL